MNNLQKQNYIYNSRQNEMYYKAIIIFYAILTPYSYYILQIYTPKKLIHKYYLNLPFDNNKFLNFIPFRKVNLDSYNYPIRLALDDDDYDYDNYYTKADNTINITNSKKIDIDQTLNQLDSDVESELPHPANYLLKKIKKSCLEQFTEDLNKKAENNEFDPIIGRSKEIERILEILSRRRKNNAILIGEPGVGKTAIVEGLACRIVEGKVPSALKNKKLIRLNLNNLAEGTMVRGQFDARLKQIILEVKEAKNIIVFIDEIHTLVSAGTQTTEGSTTDAGQILKPALSRGEFQCIGATTNEEYRKYLQKDAALERRFQRLKIEEPTINDTIAILNEIKISYEKYHNVIYTQEALETAATLSSQYITDRFLPDKAIDLIDEAGAYTRIKIDKQVLELQDLNASLELYKSAFKSSAETANRLEKRLEIQNIKIRINQITSNSINANNIITSDIITEIIAKLTSIPVNKISKTESEKLLNIESLFHLKLVGQDAAVTSVAKAIRRARAGFKNPNRPIASFIFAGPTGVGKTELAKILASHFFGTEKNIIRFDMSEYMEKHTVAKLIGSPPGYIGYNEGGQLTEAVRSKPYSVVLFDEIEKAHPDIFNILLQLLEDGRLTDSKGTTVDFKNTLIILTSNIGASIIEQNIQIQKPKKNKENSLIIQEKVSELVNLELRKYFKPEFLNRLDEIIIFHSLSFENIVEIAKIMLQQLQKHSFSQGIDLTISKRVENKVIEEGFNPIYGARPLRRAIMRIVEDNLATAFIGKDLKAGTKVKIDLDNKKDVIVEIIN